VAKEVCEKIPKEVITLEQCTAFVHLYGPYTVDMVLSKSSPVEICGSLKLCDADSADYQLIYPVIGSDSVVYKLQQDNVKKAAVYRYRIFLGSPSFLDEETLTVALDESENVDFQLTVSNKSSFTREQGCAGRAHMSCSVYTTAPGRGVWYYITVQNTQMRNNRTSHFILTATVQNEIAVQITVGMNQTRAFPVFFPVIIFALCICCLCAAKRRCQKKKMAAANAESAHVAVDMQEISAPAQGVVGYYYVAPQTGFPSMQHPYMQVPMQNLPQPVFFPQQQ